MKSLVLAALTGAAFVLTGCGAGTEPPQPEKTIYIEQQAPQSQSGFSSTEEEFLFDVSNHMTPALNREPQADVVDLGYSICGAFGRGASLEQVIDVGVDNGLTAQDTMVIAAAATVNFCPEFDGALNSGSAT